MKDKLLALVAEWESSAEALRRSNDPAFDRPYRIALLDCIDDINELLREAEREHQV